MKIKYLLLVLGALTFTACSSVQDDGSNGESDAAITDPSGATADANTVPPDANTDSIPAVTADAENPEMSLAKDGEPPAVDPSLDTPPAEPNAVAMNNHQEMPFETTPTASDVPASPVAADAPPADLAMPVIPVADAPAEAAPAEPVAEAAPAEVPAEPVADAAPVATGTGENKTYSVKSGDTLMKIAFENYGDLYRWREIFEANRDRIQDPNHVPPGTMLTLNGAGMVTIERNGEQYLIKSGDTLGSISNDVYGTTQKWKALWENNRQLIKDPNKIYAGFYLYYKPAGSLTSL